MKPIRSHILDRVVSFPFDKYLAYYSTPMQNLIGRFKRAEFLMADNIYDYFWRNALTASETGIHVELSMNSFPNSAPPWNDVFVGFTDNIKCDQRGFGMGYVYIQGGGTFLSTRSLKAEQEDDVINLWNNSGVTRPQLYNAGVRWVTYATPLVVWHDEIQLPLGYSVYHIKEDGSTYMLPVGENAHMFFEKYGKVNAPLSWYTGFLENRMIHAVAKMQNLKLDNVLGEAEGWIHDIAPAALMSFSFVHCKNVQFVNNERRIGSNGRSKILRSREPRIKFKTLRIETVKRILANEGNIKQNGLSKALHLCRGHFKDYRDGSGLFGRHKEIFWWDEHWRGDSDNGTVLKDYVAPDIYDGVRA